MKISRLIILTFMILGLFGAPAIAEDVRFAWDLSASDQYLNPADGGYRIYGSKTSGQYTAANILGTVPPGTSELTVEQPGVGLWFFVATAFDGSDESDHSNEVSKTFEIQPPLTFTITAEVAVTIPAESVETIRLVLSDLIKPKEGGSE